MQFWIASSGHAWLRRLALLAAVVCALGAAPLSAQTASHQFFGSAAAGSGVFLDGEAAPEGTLVVAFNEDGWAITSDRIERGAWAIAVPATRARTVRFALGHSAFSPAFPVVAGQETALHLTLSSGQLAAVPVRDDWVLHRFQLGDTLTSVAAQFGVAEADLRARNPQISEAGQVHPGSVIYLRPAAVPPQTAIAATTPSILATPVPPLGPRQAPTPLEAERRPTPVELDAEGSGVWWLLVAAVGLALAATVWLISRRQRAPGTQRRAVPPNTTPVPAAAPTLAPDAATTTQIASDRAPVPALVQSTAFVGGTQDGRCATAGSRLTTDALLERITRENQTLRALVADLRSTSPAKKTDPSAPVPQRLFRDAGSWGAVAYAQGAAGRILPLLHPATPSGGTERMRGLQTCIAERGDWQRTRARRLWTALPSPSLRAGLARMGLSRPTPEPERFKRDRTVGRR